MGRIFIFTGKGGVGKSSIAAAHAIKSAKEGNNTLLVSTDMAHNIGDIFECTLGKEPVEISKRLACYEIDPEYVMEHDFKNITDCMAKMFSGEKEKETGSTGMMPGMEELFSLLKISELYQSGKYDNIFVDCAPTGETLSLLKFPELLSWYMEKLFPIGKVAVRLLAPVSKAAFKVELPNKKAMNEIEKLYVKLQELQNLFKDRETTSVRIVTIPEKMVVEETKRNYMYMNLYDYNVDGIYINRILPPDIDNAFFEQWVQIQGKYIKEIEETFGNLPIYKIPWYEQELKGMDAVERIAEDSLKGDEVFKAKIINDREVFLQNDKGYLLNVPLGNAKKEELDLFQSGTDVVIKLNNFKRNIPLPNALRNYVITSAKLEDKMLKIQFENEMQ
ncbi:MAG: ArsA family ATPase [Agathobacter sp.]|nr:ArsA family ATPase [Agathobacter sp.]